VDARIARGAGAVSSHLDAGINKSTTFTYGNRNQLLTSNGYYDHGTVNTGAIAYAFDQKGNMTARNGQTYLWNEDNRLVEALVSSADPKAFLYSVLYKYDYAGRRILEYKGNSSSWWDQAYSGTAQRTRHFFNGLTEEVRKVSVGTHADDSFGFVTKGATTSAWTQTGGNGGSITSVNDTTRYSDVTRFLDNDSCASYFRTSFSPSETRRALSFWIKPVQCYPFFQIRVNTSAGVRTIAVWAQPGTNSFDGASTYRVYLGYLPANQWTRIERDLGQIISTLTPGVTYTSTGWFEVAAREFYLDDLRFSNSITVEKNVLAGGSIGHIVRNRTVDQATCAATDKWFHYDQAGSVMAVSNASGALLTRIQQDAFGNVLADWMTGQWADNDASVGWHHNTKEFSGDTGLTYMYQRWYLPEIGTFSQKDRFPGAFDVPMSMHKYSFGFQSPTRFADPDGNVSAAFATAMSGCIIGAAIQLGYDIWKYYAGAALPATAAAWAASYICACGFGALAVTGFFGVGPIGVGVLARPLATATTAQGAGLIAGAISFGCLKGACNTIVAEILTGLPTPTPGQYWYDPVGVNVGGGYPIVFF
jgi:RHS repeat-associated protein